MNYRRINLLGGPGIGKSTTAAIVYGELKKRSYNIELVSEYVKTWAIQNKKIQKYDQYYIFGKQQQYEYRYLSHGVDCIITDSPVLLSGIYTEKYFGYEAADPIFRAGQLYEREFNSINLVLQRDSSIFSQQGRYEGLDASIEVDELIIDRLESLGYNYEIVNGKDIDSIINLITKSIF